MVIQDIITAIQNDTCLQDLRTNIIEAWPLRRPDVKQYTLPYCMFKEKAAMIDRLSVELAQLQPKETITLA